MTNRYFKRALLLASRFPEGLLVESELDPSETIWNMRRDQYLGDFFRAARLHLAEGHPVSEFAEFDSHQPEILWLCGRVEGSSCLLELNFGYGFGRQEFMLQVSEAGVVAIRRHLQWLSIEAGFFLKHIRDGHIQSFLTLAETAAPS